MEDLSIHVLKAFNINPISIKKIKSCYVCNTKEGLKMINKTKDSVESIIFQNEIKNHLILNGFYNIDKFYLTQDNIPYYIFNNNVYIMTDVFNYNQINYFNKEEFLYLIKVIAKFHLSLSSIKFKADTLFYGDNIKNDYINSYNEFLHIKKIIGCRKRLTDIDVIFLKNYNYYLEIIKSSIDCLNDTNYDILKNKLQIKNNISHNLLRKENIFIDKKEIYISNFSNSKIDINIIDLNILIKKYIKYVGKEAISIDKIIEIYSNYRQLNEDEIKILYSMLIYPEKFIKICLEYYKKKRTWVPRYIIDKMQQILDKREIYYKYLENNTIINKKLL